MRSLLAGWVTHHATGPTMAFVGFVLFCLGPVFHDHRPIWYPGSQIVAGLITVLGLWMILYAWHVDFRRRNSELVDVVKQLELAKIRSDVAQMASPGSDTIREMTRKAFMSLLDKNLPTLVRTLRDFHQEEKKEVDFDDSYLANNSLVELLELLPDGSVWFGMSRVAGDSWESEHLKSFLLKSRSRSRAGTILMRRLYVHETDELLVPLATIDAERRASVDLRQLKVAEGDLDATAPPDVSLVWKPTRSLASGPNITGHNLGSLVNGPDYEPVGALEFDLGVRSSLVRVTVYAPDADRFLELQESFQHYWEQAAEVS